MPSKQTTTVVLNEFIQKIKDELTPVYGLKNILSAGLLLFSRLSGEEQKEAIQEVNASRQAGQVVAAAEAEVEVQKQKKGPRQSKAG